MGEEDADMELNVRERTEALEYEMLEADAAKSREAVRSFPMQEDSFRTKFQTKFCTSVHKTGKTHTGTRS